jgi:hypothetical protein
MVSEATVPYGVTVINLFPKADRSFVLQQQLLLARRRVEAERPYSPSWDAAMANLEDVEREIWRGEPDTAAHLGSAR